MCLCCRADVKFPYCISVVWKVKYVSEEKDMAILIISRSKININQCFDFWFTKCVLEMFPILSAATLDGGNEPKTLICNPIQSYELKNSSFWRKLHKLRAPHRYTINSRYDLTLCFFLTIKWNVILKYHLLAISPASPGYPPPLTPYPCVPLSL